MIFDLIGKGKVKINMDAYFEKIINDFPIKIRNSDTYLTPAGNNLFENVIEKVWIKKN